MLVFEMFDIVSDTNERLESNLNKNERFGTMTIISPILNDLKNSKSNQIISCFTQVKNNYIDLKFHYSTV